MSSNDPLPLPPATPEGQVPAPADVPQPPVWYPPPEPAGYVPAPADNVQWPPAPYGYHPAGPWYPPPAPPPPRPLFRKPHPNFWWAIVWCVGFLLVTQVPGGVVAAVIMVVAFVVSPQTLPMDNMGNIKSMVQNDVFRFALAVAFFITELLVIAASWVALRIVNGRDWPRKVALRWPGFVHLVLVVLSFPAMWLMANGVVVVLSALAKKQGAEASAFEETMKEMMEVFTQWPWAFAVLVIGLGPGIGEELWCRAFLGRGLMGRHGVVGGVILTSFFFGAIHIIPIQGTMAALMGLWLHFVYLTTRSLWMPMLLHFLNNSLAVTAMRVERLRGIEEASATIPSYVYLAGAVLMLTIGAALYQSRARLVGEEGGAPLWLPECPGVEWPPAGSGTRVAHPWPSVGALGLVVLGMLAFVGACVAVGR